MSLHQIKSGIIVPRLGTGLQPMGSGFVRAGAAVGGGTTCEWIDSDSVDTGAGTTDTVTFTALGVGAADANRTIVFAIEMWASGSLTISSITVDGNAPTHVKSNINPGNNLKTYIYIIQLASVTDVDVVITFDSSATRCVGIDSYRVISDLFTIKDNKGSGDTNPNLINVDPGGFVIACGVNTNSTAHTWTGVTEDSDRDIRSNEWASAASLENFAGSSPLTVSSTTAAAWSILSGD